MATVRNFCKDCPVGFEPCERVDPSCRYKYFLCGKGCTLGVLFEDSVNLYLEWIAEDGSYVPYPADLRYKAWPKHEVAKLMTRGVWEASQEPELVPA